MLDESPTEYITRMVLWEIEVYGSTCIGNVVVQPQETWCLSVGDWYDHVKRVFAHLVARRRIEVLMLGQSTWYVASNALDRIVGALNDSDGVEVPYERRTAELVATSSN